MTIFRLLLYLTCTFSISWSAVVFLGPAVITRIVASYTNGAVELSKVKLSPMLDLSIGRLDFEIYGVNPISGFSRSTEIKWSLMSDKPFLIFDIGPTVIKDILTVKNTKVSTDLLVVLIGFPTFGTRRERTKYTNVWQCG